MRDAEGSDRGPARRRPLLGVAAVGAAAGFLAGLFGVGGGILLVPGLVLLAGMGQRRAHGTSLAAILPIAAAGTVGYALDGAVDLPGAGLLTVGAAAGALLGTRALRRVPERTLAIVFAGFMLASAAALPFEVTGADADVALTPVTAAAVVGVGFLSGTLAGLLGVGGGIVMVPGLILLMGVAQTVARGTSLLVIIPTALVGTVRNVRAGNADLRNAAVAGGAGVPMAVAGSLVSLLLDPLISAVLFGVLLVAVAVHLLVSRRGAEATPPPR